MERRAFIKTGAAGTAALTAAACGISPPRGPLRSVRVYAAALFNALDANQRQAACVAYDHPLRQYHNRGVFTGGARLEGSRWSRKQLDLAKRLLFAGLSEQGRGIIPNQYFLQFGGIQRLMLLIAGDPNAGRFQVIFSGPHVNLRLGGKSVEEVAFGGPQVYGDQRGNNDRGLPGNVYRPQFLKACELFATLSAAQQRRALGDRAPVQTMIELQGAAGDFAGASVRELSPASKQKAAELVAEILAPHHPDEVAYAWRCLERNGGLDALHLSFYREGEADSSGAYQVFRLEGPAAVLYFRGFPHVHAFINIGMDGEKPLSVGEALGGNPRPLRDNGVKTFFERAMKDRCGADFGYYDPASVAGRLRAGEIRSGDIYNLESWNNDISVVTVKGSELGGSMRRELDLKGVRLEPAREYAIATTDHVAKEQERDAFGGGKARHEKIPLREAAIDWLREHGFPMSG